jgi:hypothetical protein
MRPLFVSALVAAASIAVAQTPAVPPAATAPATPVSAAQKRAVIDNLAQALIDDFVFPEVGQRYATALRGKLATGAYDSLGDAVSFATQVTADLQAVHEDRHLRLTPPGTPPRRAANGQPLKAIEEAKWAAPGVAYIKFNMFPGEPATLALLERFMAEHATARALIIDARTHRGGGLSEMDVMLPYLFAEPIPLVQMDTRAAVAAAGRAPIDLGPTVRALDGPEGIVRREHVAIPGKPTPLRRARVFYLTSARTASAAEHLALALKRTGRATLIGETTRGAGHYGRLAQLGSGFTAFVPIGRTFDPDTGKGWEGTGIVPNVAVPADRALDEALRRAGVTES